jgi:DNA-binding transcriptional ArsR family regulator
MNSLKRILYWLLQGTKGGPTRISLLKIIAKKPMNLRQLALASKLDYKTVEHHVRLLTENSILEVSGNGYGKIYFISDAIASEKDYKSILEGGTDGNEKRKKA